MSNDHQVILRNLRISTANVTVAVWNIVCLLSIKGVKGILGADSLDDHKIVLIVFWLLSMPVVWYIILALRQTADRLEKKEFLPRVGDVARDCGTCGNRAAVTKQPCPPELVNQCQPTGKPWTFVHWRPETKGGRR